MRLGNDAVGLDHTISDMCPGVDLCDCRCGILRDHDIFSDLLEFDQAVGSDRGAQMDALLKCSVRCETLREFIKSPNGSSENKALAFGR